MEFQTFPEGQVFEIRVICAFKLVGLYSLSCMVYIKSTVWYDFVNIAQNIGMQYNLDPSLFSEKECEWSIN